MQKIKAIMKYSIIFCVIVVSLASGLILTSCIPKEFIETNLQESAEFYKDKYGIQRLHPIREELKVHYYADSVLLNIIYCLNTEQPIQSTLWANYYETEHADTNDDFIKVVEEKENPNTQYLRYWHGSMMIIRPLLLIFNIKEIYLFNRRNISWLSNSFIGTTV